MLSCMRQDFLTSESLPERAGSFDMFKPFIGNILKYKHIYLCHVDNYIGAYDPYTGKVRYETGDKFVQFVQKILNEFPDYSPHNVINEGIQEVIRQKIQSDRLSMEILGKSR